jgi:hypothetical protein
MKARSSSCPLTPGQALDLYFVEHRAKLLDLAALLDRLDRARSAAQGDEDYRLAALRRAIKVLIDGRPDRARRVLELLSDPTQKPIDSALGLKPAAGAFDARGSKRAAAKRSRVARGK